MPNRSYIKEKVVKKEWIILEPPQVQQLHDVALRISLEVEKSNDKPALVKMYYDISDMVQKKKEITVKQLAALQKGMRVTFQETLYVAGLEFWLLQNEKKVSQKRKEHATKKLNGTDRDRYGRIIE